MDKLREELEKYMKDNHPFINSKSDAYLAMWNIWQASSIPEGYVVVPKEPTPEMIEALESGFDFDHSESRFYPYDAYRAMIEAVERNDE